MIDWDSCISKETVIIREDGIKELFLMRDEDHIFIRDIASGTAHTISIMNFSYSSIEERTKLNPGLLKEDESILIDENGSRYKYLMMVGESMIACLKINNATFFAVSAYPKNIWETWTVVQDG